jgi:hypothetical protein
MEKYRKDSSGKFLTDTDAAPWSGPTKSSGQGHG